MNRSITHAGSLLYLESCDPVGGLPSVLRFLFPLLFPSLAKHVNTIELLSFLLALCPQTVPTPMTHLRGGSPNHVPDNHQHFLLPCSSFASPQIRQ
jgi:hypothetical protein